MRPLGFAGARPPPISYRSTATTTGSTTITKPSSVAVGDIVFIITAGNAGAFSTITTSSGSAWTAYSRSFRLGSYDFYVWVKILNSTDVSNNWVASASADYRATAFIGNGAATVTQKAAADNPDGSSTLALGTYDPLRSRGTVTMVADRDAGSTLTAPSNFANLQQSDLNSSWRVGICDNQSYDGAAVTWGVGSTFAEAGMLFDVT